MKSQQTSKKLGKRTVTLKELAKRNFATAHQKVSEDPTDSAPTLNLVNLAEDLLDIGNANTGPIKETKETIETKKTPVSEDTEPILNVDISKESMPRSSSTPSLAIPMGIIHELLKKEIGQTAAQLGLEKSELQAWIDLQVMAPQHILLALLRLARANHLDPLQEEVALALYEDAHWQAYITVEGYSKLLNRHPAFDGIVFTPSEETTDGIPIWMECAIYRKDRSRPVVVREYFEEVKGEQLIWQKMPRRMLRHRVMAQCARLAVGP